MPNTYTKNNPNQYPYWDDFDNAKSNNYIRMLFAPARAVQARELTQMQTILQNQVSSLGDHIFKNGSPVLGGQISITTDNPFIELPTSEIVIAGTGTPIASIQDLVGRHIKGYINNTFTTGAETGALAEIVKIDDNTTDSTITVGRTRLQLLMRGGSFSANDYFRTFDYSDSDIDGGLTDYESYASGSGIVAIGNALKASAQSGIIYINGAFVLTPGVSVWKDGIVYAPNAIVSWDGRIYRTLTGGTSSGTSLLTDVGIVDWFEVSRAPDQEIFVQTNGTGQNYVVGWLMSENVVTQTEDPSLGDPLPSGSNSNAIGADRYQIKIDLVSYRFTTAPGDLDAIPDDFYSVITYLGVDSSIAQEVERPEYSDILDLLARRTYDESGSYILEPYSCEAIPFDANNFYYRVGPGRGYVYGYEVENIAHTNVVASKARTTRDRVSAEAQTIIPKYGTFVKIRVAPTAKTFDGTTGVSANLITIPEHGFSTGDPLVYTGSGITELTSGLTYYAIYDTKNTIYLATSAANATSETQMTLTPGGATQTLTGGAQYNGMPDPVAFQQVYLMDGYAGAGTEIGTARIYFADELSNTAYLYLGDNPSLNTDLLSTKSIADTNDNAPTAWFNIEPFSAVTNVRGYNLPIIEIPGQPVKQVNNISYTTVYKEAVAVAAGSAWSITLTGNLSFSGSDAEDPLVLIHSSSGTPVSFATALGTTPSLTGTTLTSDTDHGLSNDIYPVYVIVSVSAETIRSKTLTQQIDTITTVGALTELTLNGVTGIGESTRFDIAALASVIKDPGGAALDVTSQFKMSSGQKDLYYDYGKIVGPFDAATTYDITYYYWAWSGTGSYFAANSYSDPTTYLDDFGGAYASIPTYKNEAGTKSFNLRSCLDFRKSVVQLAVVREIPQPAGAITIDYQYYLPRWDKIWINGEGTLGVTEGIPEESPRPPPDKQGTLTLFSAYVSPYTYGPNTGQPTFEPSQIAIRSFEYKSYTMADINKIENRLKGIEAYVSESQLELDSYADTVLDTDGLPRSKNGIFVDRFTDHSKGEVWDPAYRCSMKKDEGLLRCPYEMNYVALQYTDTPAAAGVQTNTSEQNASPWEHVITLDYNSVEYIHQGLASEWTNINPFAVTVWAGECSMNPASDTWIETRYLPALQISDPIEAEKILALYERADAGIPQWGEWTSSVIGVETTSTGGVSGFPNGRWRERRDWTNPGGQFLWLDEEIATTTTTQSTREGSILEQSGTQTITQDMGERIVDRSSIPWMRPIEITFKAEGLRPNTAFIPYFADVNVQSVTTNAFTDLQFISGTPATITRVSSGTSFLNIFDNPDATIEAEIPPQFVRVVGSANNDGAYRVASVTATTITLAAGETLTNEGTNNVSASLDLSYIQFLDKNNNVTTKTDKTGYIKGVFSVPAKTFRTGKSIFTMVDTDIDPLSLASTEFMAAGTLISKQDTFISVEVPVYTTRAIFEVVETSQTTTTGGTPRNARPRRETDADPAPAPRPRGNTRWRDPLAQTFLIEDTGGIFLESVDIFFYSKDRYLPVTLYIVETTVGIPGQKILPFASVTKNAWDIAATRLQNMELPFDDVSNYVVYNGKHFNEADNEIAANGEQVVAGQDLAPAGWTGNNAGSGEFLSTNFKFSDPIYLSEGVEYAFVLVSNSNNYNVYNSRVGSYDFITGAGIAEQPYLGSMLKSQNASTWTPDQMADIQFRLNRCDFDDSASAIYMRMKGTDDYWNNTATYRIGDKVIFNHTTNGLGKYVCIVATSAGQSPETTAASWHKIGDGFYDTGLLNITMDDMQITGTAIRRQYLIDPNTTWLNFTNKADIQLDASDTVELYTYGQPQNPAEPDGLNLKLQMTTGNTKHSPVINKNRTNAVLVNNLVVTPGADAPTPTPTWDAGEYISETTYLRDPAGSLKVLLDISLPNAGAKVVPKFKINTETLRYVVADSDATGQSINQGLKDQFAYVYQINSVDLGVGSAVDTPLGTAWVPRSQVIVDGFDEDAAPDKVYLSSIGNSADFRTNGANSWVLITTEPDIDGTEIFVWNNADDYSVGEYVIHPSTKQLYVSVLSGANTNGAEPTPNSTDWLLIPCIFVDGAVQTESGTKWRSMTQINTVSPLVDTTYFVEYEFEPTVVPSEDFENFTIKIEMYSDDKINVPECKRLRAIAVT